MKKNFLLILIMVISIITVACGENNKNENGSESLNSNISADLLPETTEETVTNNSKNNSVEIDNNESSWVEFDNCFCGEYSQQLPYEDGTDVDGNTVWAMYDSYLKITKDYIYIDIPEGKYELTPKNSRLFGDEYLSVIPFDEMTEEWRFIFHNKENLLAGNLYISMQTATNQYTLYKI